MTQPVQEPLTQRSIGSLQWGSNQLFRRPDPNPTSYLAYCWMRWVGSEAVPADTLFNPATGPTPDVPYEESFIYDPTFTAGFTCNLDIGCITWDFPGEYYVWASVEWNGSGSTGTLAGVLDLGEGCTFSTVRVVNHIIADAVNENMQIPVDTMMFNFGSDRNSVRVLVYHTDAGGNDIGAVWIHVVQVNPNVDGEFAT